MATDSNINAVVILKRPKKKTKKKTEGNKKVYKFALTKLYIVIYT